MERVWGARLEIDTKKVINNINKIKEYIGDDVDIMPVIKDESYGTYVFRENLDILEKTKIKIVAVAIVDEGIRLRESGYKRRNIYFESTIKAGVTKHYKI